LGREQNNRIRLVDDCQRYIGQGRSGIDNDVTVQVTQIFQNFSEARRLHSPVLWAGRSSQDFDAGGRCSITTSSMISGSRSSARRQVTDAVLALLVQKN
jgi:hypothetical protein